MMSANFKLIKREDREKSLPQPQNVVDRDPECARISIRELKSQYFAMRRSFLAFEAYVRSLGVDLKSE